MGKFEKGLVAILGGIVLAAVGAELLRALAGGMLASMFALERIDKIGFSRDVWLRVLLLFLFYLPALYAGGTKGPAGRLLVGLGATFLFAAIQPAATVISGENIRETALMFGLSLAIVGCLTSWRRYVGAFAAGVLIAFSANTETKPAAVLVLGLVFLGPVLAMGVGVLHVQERVAKSSNQTDSGFVIEPAA